MPGIAERTEVDDKQVQQPDMGIQHHMKYQVPRNTTKINIRIGHKQSNNTEVGGANYNRSTLGSNKYKIDWTVVGTCDCYDCCQILLIYNRTINHTRALPDTVYKVPDTIQVPGSWWHVTKHDTSNYVHSSSTSTPR